jgi:NADH-quinone oxidoreductase subunit L
VTSFGGAFVLSTIALIIAVVGIVVARAIYLNGLNPDGTDPGAVRLGAFANVLANGYYIDAAWSRFVDRVLRPAALLISNGLDRGVIDGAVNGIATLARQSGQGLRRVQTGLVRNYALAIVGGAVVLLVYIGTRATF